MAKYQYRTFTIHETRERDIDLDVQAQMDEAQDDGWEYVSGPVIAPSGGYLFLVRKKDNPNRIKLEDVKARAVSREW